MYTIDKIKNESGLCRTAVMYRIKKLGLPARYKMGDYGRAVRIFDDDEASLVINFAGYKTGPKKIGA